jgi:hypothetical protein
MRISGAYPSTYLKAADLQDRNVPVVIDKVVMELIVDEHKPVVYFQNHERGLVLNKTNANNIAHIYGDETDDWIGKEIILYPTIVDFQGRSVDAIRVKAPARRPAVQAPGPTIERKYADDRITSGPQRIQTRDDIDDPSIPF